MEFTEEVKDYKNESEKGHPAPTSLDQGRYIIKYVSAKKSPARDNNFESSDEILTAEGHSHHKWDFKNLFLPETVKARRVNYNNKKVRTPLFRKFSNL